MAEVFVVDRAALFGGAWPQGFLPLDQAAGDALLESAWSQGRFVDRETAERTPAWKQWIPYCVLRCTGENPARQHNPAVAGIFRVRRTKGQSEARLHGLWSIGLGGHVEPQDEAPATADPAADPTADPTQPRNPGAAFFARSLDRELHEELHLDLPAGVAPRFVGLLNDDGTAVGEVHAGLVYVLDVPLDLPRAEQSVRVREISKMSGGFGSLVEFLILWQDRQRFETWSQFLVDAGVALPMGTTANPGV